MQVQRHAPKRRYAPIETPRSVREIQAFVWVSCAVSLAQTLGLIVRGERKEKEGNRKEIERKKKGKGKGKERNTREPRCSCLRIERATRHTANSTWLEQHCHI